MSTYIHGIAASENIDTSGEIVSIAGLDISSLDRDGVINWEHKSDQPSQVVGKILKAKKIFSDADCDDDHQLHFWEKCKTPFVYVMGELLDDYSDSAREVAGKFRYDADHNNERNMMNFSVEGSKISKEGITVTRSIARKVTCTILPCNKMAVAEIVLADQKNPKKNAIDELFKTETVEIEVLNIDSKSKLWDLLKKEDPNKHASKLGIKPFKKDMAGGASAGLASTALSGVTPTSAGNLMRNEKLDKAAPLSVAKPGAQARGTPIGRTSTGKDVHSHGMVGDYGFNAKEHREAAGFHRQAASNAATKKDSSAALHHTNKFRIHESAAHNAEKASTQAAATAHAANAKPQPKIAPPPLSPTQPKTMFHPHMSGKMKPPGPQRKSEMAKAMTAGSGLAAPDRLTGGAALSKENLDKNIAMPMNKDAANPKLAPKDVKVKKLQSQVDAGTYKPDASKIAGAMLQHPEKPLKGTKVQKSEWLQRAEAEYASWNKREQFEQFMQKRLPSLTRSEIQVIGQTMLLQKSLKQEKMLKDFYDPSTLKSEKK